MRTLYLLRHAKSSWDDPALDDHDRPLNARGRRAAGAMGSHLERADAAPSLVLCSSARRARETLSLVLPHLRGECDVTIERALYLASLQELLDRLRAVDGQHHGVLAIGHNPSLHELACALAGSGGADELAALRRKFPTAALAVLEFELENWRDLAPGVGRLGAFTAPRELS